MPQEEEKEGGDGGDGGDVLVVMVPLPLQGHLNQLLHLSRFFLSRGVPVHYISTASHSRQARLRLHGWDPFHPCTPTSVIRFHDVPIVINAPDFPPRPRPRTNFPSHLQPLLEEASSRLRLPVRNLVRSLASRARKIVVINDSLMGSAVQDIVSIPNAESYTFHSVSAFVLFLYMWESEGKPVEADGVIPEKLPSLEGCYSEGFRDFVRSQYKYKMLSRGAIYNSCRVIEGPYLDLLGDLEAVVWRNRKSWALGPFNPVMVPAGDKNDKGSIHKRHHSLEWLDKQSLNSVVYVSFGSTTSFCDEQIKEIAKGLRQSNQRFIWVLRDADAVDIFEGKKETAGRGDDDQLPEDYQESVKGMGIVVRDWAPQLEILAHPSTGGFVSHCGWNSCMESLTMGIPIGSWPVHSDQPRNAALVTEMLRVGLVVKEWVEREEIVKARDVEKAVRRLMLSKEGEEMRKRAKELGCRLRSAVAEGGVSSLELDAFISHIRR